MRSELLDAAEQLFGATSVDAVSMRAVAREAGVTQTAVMYHFSDKPSLVNAVLRRRAEPVGDAVRDALVALAEHPEPPSVEELVWAVMRPLVVVLNENPTSGIAWMKLLNTLAVTEDADWLRGVGRSPSIGDLFTAVFDRIVPGPATLERYQRVGIAMYSMLDALAGADSAGYGRPLTDEGLDPGFVCELVSFVSSGLDSIRSVDVAELEDLRLSRAEDLTG